MNQYAVCVHIYLSTCLVKSYLFSLAFELFTGLFIIDVDVVLIISFFFYIILTICDVQHFGVTV